MQDSPLFAPLRRRRGPLAASAPHEDQPVPPQPTCPDAALLAILDAPLREHETAALGFARKESELGNAFAELTILAAYTLHKRLANPLPGDTLAERFTTRLTIDRRNRLLAFLADARRRAALAGGR